MRCVEILDKIAASIPAAPRVNENEPQAPVNQPNAVAVVAYSPPPLDNNVPLPDDPSMTCGVCKEECIDGRYAIDACGHYPYCETCISAMSTGSAGFNNGLKLRCPQCNIVNQGTYKVNFF